MPGPSQGRRSAPSRTTHPRPASRGRWLAAVPWPRRSSRAPSGTWAIALAASWVRAGRADVVLAGGTDLLCRFVVSGFNALKATAPEARPFDRDRRGLVLGEGAAIVVVESAAHAARRGARARARIAGLGASGDAVHMTAPDREGRGAARAISAALVDAGFAAGRRRLRVGARDGTPYNDAMEAVAITRVFGPRRVPVNSIKGPSAIRSAPAGPFETVLCVAAMETGRGAADAGLAEVDPACATLDLVHGSARATPVRVSVSTSSGFAGANAALVLSRRVSMRSSSTGTGSVTAPSLDALPEAVRARPRERSASRSSRWPRPMRRSSMPGSTSSTASPAPGSASSSARRSAASSPTPPTSTASRPAAPRRRAPGSSRRRSRTRRPARSASRIASGARR
jgi:hypothetical protein